MMPLVNQEQFPHLPRPPQLQFDCLHSMSLPHIDANASFFRGSRADRHTQNCIIVRTIVTIPDINMVTINQGTDKDFLIADGNIIRWAIDHRDDTAIIIAKNK